MSIQTLARWFERRPSVEPAAARRTKLEARSKHRIGIPKVLNVWTTHQFWLGFFGALGIPNNRVVFSSDTSEGQMREYRPSGRGTVDCCYPVKCIVGPLRRAGVRPEAQDRHPVLADDLFAAVLSPRPCDGLARPARA